MMLTCAARSAGAWAIPAAAASSEREKAETRAGMTVVAAGGPPGATTGTTTGAAALYASSPVSYELFRKFATFSPDHADFMCVRSVCWQGGRALCAGIGRAPITRPGRSELRSSTQPSSSSSSSGGSSSGSSVRAATPPVALCICASPLGAVAGRLRVRSVREPAFRALLSQAELLWGGGSLGLGDLPVLLRGAAAKPAFACALNGGAAAALEARVAHPQAGVALTYLGVVHVCT